ncbi:hypothetical protein L3049_14935 [Labilibaculum sp. DW002]|uniref:Uncharacterized protein n=1 Tax=Paralabilibaculum antarcticum TaxID=2912572 RepID=A0ABT5VYE5_9BACT|nr:hypothetical protein [Labilibaculum sp. DW002]MDE5419294.1 hypothetical protein [Labilibaculum sp. DW002]
MGKKIYQLFKRLKSISLLRFVKNLVFLIIFGFVIHFGYEIWSRYMKYRICGRVDFANFTLPLTDYYVEYERCPKEISELLQYMYGKSYERDYILIEMSEKLELKIIERENKLFIYDVGFDGVDDLLEKKIIIYYETKFSEIFFKDGDILVYRAEYSRFKKNDLLLIE